MTKLEFMKELESLLSDIPLEEREEALQYYNGYFEDAGEEHEQEIIKELVSPQKVAAIIKESLNSNGADSENRGYFTENGYQNSMDNDEKYEMVGSNKKFTGNGQNSNTNRANNTNWNNSNGNNNRNASGQGQNSYNNAEDKAAKDRDRNTKIALLIIVCIVGSPFIASVFGIVISIICAILGIIIGFGVAGAAMIICGIALFIAGLIKITVPLVGMLLCGGGLVVLGLGMLFTLACVLLCKNVLPAFVKWILNICRRPFQNRSVAA